MIYETIEQELDRQGRSLFQTVGDSMEPLLHDRKSTVLIEKPSAILKKYDVVLYRRPARKYVLHRIVKIRKKYYLICGDNRIQKEAVPREWVLGVMIGFYPDESDRFISCEDKEYQKYLRTWGIRYVIRWVKAFPSRLRRRCMW